MHPFGRARDNRVSAFINSNKGGHAMLNTTYRSLDNELKYIFPPRLSQILVSVNAQRALEEIRIRVNSRFS